MITAEQIINLVQEKIEGTDLFVVAVHVHPGNKIEVLLDSDSALTIEHCVEVSRYIGSKLDREVEDYGLDVSSPGLSQPLKLKRQYAKNLSREVVVKLRDGKKIEGTLAEVGDDHIHLTTKSREILEGTKKKAWVEKQVSLPFEQIDETKIVISFK